MSDSGLQEYSLGFLEGCWIMLGCEKETEQRVCLLYAVSFDSLCSNKGIIIFLPKEEQKLGKRQVEVLPG